MYQPILDFKDASIYARNDMQKLTREILRIEGIRALGRMVDDY